MDVESPLFATAIFSLVGFVVGSSFLGMMGMASDAIVLIFTMDIEIQKYHTGVRASKYTPAPLRSLIKELGYW